MADWTDLTEELDRWALAGRRATFWWRDDDAGPDDGSPSGGVGRRDKRVGAVIDVEQGALGSFKQNIFAPLDRIPDEE